MLDTMKLKFKHSIVIGIIAIIMLGIITVVAQIASSYSDQRYSKSHDGCALPEENHMVVIQNDQVIPTNTFASRCDTLTITNNDTTKRILAFGFHSDHVAYDGILEQTLFKDQGLTVTLIQSGTFTFHDHLHDKIQGTFQVK